MSNKNDYLDRIKSKEPAYPDAAFFDQLALNVIASQQEIPFKKPLVKRAFIKWMAAAVLIPLVLFFVLPKSGNATSSVIAMLEDVPMETISAYVQAQQVEEVTSRVVSPSANENSIVVELVEEVSVSEISSYLEEEYGNWDLEDVE